MSKDTINNLITEILNNLERMSRHFDASMVKVFLMIKNNRDFNP